MSRRRGPHTVEPDFENSQHVCVLCGLVGVYEYEMRGPCPNAPFVDKDPVNIKRGKASKRKGARYELEVAHDFTNAGFPVRRTPASGGLHIKGDLVGLEGFHVECKRTERLQMHAALDQAQNDAQIGQTPLVVFRRSNTPSFVALPLKDFLGLLLEARIAQDKAA